MGFWVKKSCPAHLGFWFQGLPKYVTHTQICAILDIYNLTPLTKVNVHSHLYIYIYMDHWSINVQMFHWLNCPCFIRLNCPRQVYEDSTFPCRRGVGSKPIQFHGLKILSEKNLTPDPHIYYHNIFQRLAIYPHYPITDPHKMVIHQECTVRRRGYLACLGISQWGHHWFFRGILWEFVMGFMGFRKI